MERIASFTIDHTKLNSGLYVSRKDKVGKEIITTFDLRVCRPYVNLPLRTNEIHAIEHLAATYLRNRAELKDKIIYFGPMGCRTGFYLIVAGDYSSEDILPIVLDCFIFISHYDGPIPGATLEECGNYMDMDLSKAKVTCHYYAKVLSAIDDDRLYYPQ